ncbi:Bcpan3 [Botrytis cinerea B05.10]|uniref:PAN2-PAN3 deadenylation complex subunit PAN3 n=3 Tax=Botryotinia fuckeliana TaxID=40559 RepID=A0A384JTN2_BOTFB|nr:Bcpan3 [Botrytis cinerea B05.10]ATZ53929.1 Bcpan3 [Botrytis cinerea B05.10]EMR87293.1 putative pab-dependent poly -specific ribonuclease subunit pan3 protein [Botrytis cinerea BcDW1]CCD50157.1 similar to PAB-dependent poly(A)-specific ribonuclease subunit pan3 [Botrytis cinerea T4]
MDNPWHKPWLVVDKKDHPVSKTQVVSPAKTTRKRVWKDRHTSGSAEYSPTSVQEKFNHSSTHPQQLSRLETPYHGRDLGSNERPGQKLTLLNTNFNDDRPKKALNVDSPSFTPATISSSNKGASSITSQAANAAPFTPRGLTSGTATPNAPLDPEIPQFNPTQRDFTPQNYDLSQTLPTNGATPEATYDPFSMGSVSQTIPTTFQNHYSEDLGILAGPGVGTGGAGGTYFQGQPNYSVQPLNYHFYAPIGPHTDNLTPYQKSIHDLFLSDRLREELQRKSEAYHQAMPNALPTIGTSPNSYHSLVALDTTQNRSTAVFGCTSWVYKAMAEKNGKFCCLRRLEGYTLANDKAIRAIKKWNEVNSAGVVSFIDAFTTRQFKDGSSLIIVTNYHPLSKTLLEVHFSTTNTSRYRNQLPRISEDILWAYIVQITVAIKAVHQANFAVRCMHLSKVILTEKNRIRLNACPIFDILHYEQRRDIKELQYEDLHLFGILMLSLATVNASITPQTNPQVLQTNIDSLSRIYSAELVDTIMWLLTTPSSPETKDLQTFIRGISGRMATAFDSSLQANDELTSDLGRELENARLVRLMAKLGNINERPEYENNPQWSETGNQYTLKLFRDYVFHSVDPEGRPVTDMAWIIKCLNKLDAGSDEKIQLTSRDGENCFIVSFKEIKKQVNTAWGDLQKPGKRF